MIKHGYLTPPERLDMPVVQYDFSRLQAQSNGLFSGADLNPRAEKNSKRITPHIISQIMEFAATRKVMISPRRSNTQKRLWDYCLPKMQH